jgi:hypothetical protein
MHPSVRLELNNPRDRQVIERAPVARAEKSVSACLWCNMRFHLHGRGGKRQFCSTSCRIAFHSACRMWAVRAVLDGRLGLDAVRNASRKPCTPVPVAPTRPPLVEDPERAPAAVETSQRRAGGLESASKQPAEPRAVIK